MRRIRTYIAVLLAVAVAVSASGCSAKVKAANLMESISRGSVEGKAANSVFIANAAEFSLKLFRESIEDEKNSLISPLSAMLALAMTANGAGGKTLAQMESLLGGNIPLAELNEYLYSYANSLPSKDKSKLNIANSIWFRGDGDSLKVEESFLQKNADYYGAAAYSSAFDDKTVEDINGWVKSNTDGMIEKILDEINDLAMLFLINTVLFDAEWQSVYRKYDIRKSTFYGINGNERDVEFMHSAEYGYLDDGMATGFIKPYANGTYSFAALLPNTDISIQEYIKTLTGASFLDVLNNKQHDMLVYASMPKFEYDYSISMVDALKALGVHDAFDEYFADFSSMGTTNVGNGNLYISEVLHKTYISVDELGTKAGAATMVAMDTGGSTGPPEHKVVDLDRPFVFAIIDNATNLPVFIGTLLTAGDEAVIPQPQGDAVSAENDPDNDDVDDNSGNNGEEPSADMPGDFAFSLDFDTYGKNNVDTYNSTFTKDLVANGTETIYFVIPPDTMQTLYDVFISEGIYELPDDINAHAMLTMGDLRMQRHPAAEYKLTYTCNGITRTIVCNDGGPWDADTREPDARNKLASFAEHIAKYIYNTEEYNGMSPAVGGYD